MARARAVGQTWLSSTFSALGLGRCCSFCLEDSPGPQPLPWASLTLWLLLITALTLYLREAQFWVFQGLALFLGYQLPEEDKAIVNIYWVFTTCTTHIPYAVGAVLWNEEDRSRWRSAQFTQATDQVRYCIKMGFKPRSGWCCCPVLNPRGSECPQHQHHTRPRGNTQSMRLTGMIDPSWNFPLALIWLKETIWALLCPLLFLFSVTSGKSFPPLGNLWLWIKDGLWGITEKQGKRQLHKNGNTRWTYVQQCWT